MNIEDILHHLIAERDKLNVAIAALQGVGVPKRLGRPPKNSFAAEAAVPPIKATKRIPPKRTKVQREAQAEKMKQYWEERRRQKAVAIKKTAKKGGKKSAKPQVTPAA